ncbi:hypothetical protein HK102_012448, partial [Quaeritorhiza haematococci]
MDTATATTTATLNPTWLASISETSQVSVVGRLVLVGVGTAILFGIFLGIVILWLRTRELFMDEEAWAGQQGHSRDNNDDDEPLPEYLPPPPEYSSPSPRSGIFSMFRSASRRTTVGTPRTPHTPWSPKTPKTPRTPVSIITRTRSGSLGDIVGWRRPSLLQQSITNSIQQQQQQQRRSSSHSQDEPQLPATSSNSTSTSTITAPTPAA